ncbi:MAG: hypothetical protein OXC13_01115 [Caldilineaceae bacterium]|nr:hypothetical protein [Caldilineaceae bacterium]
MAGQSNYDPKTEQAKGFPEGVTAELVNTLHKTAKLSGPNAANACKAALALALLKEHGLKNNDRALKVIMGMDANSE